MKKISFSEFEEGSEKLKSSTNFPHFHSIDAINFHFQENKFECGKWTFPLLGVFPPFIISFRRLWHQHQPQLRFERHNIQIGWSSDAKSFQENRYTTYQTTSAPTSAAPVKFRAEDMATQNKYVTHYPTTSSSTHLQYYNTPSNQQQPENPKSSYITTTTIPSSVTTASELSQDITSLLLKEQGGSDSTKRVLQSSSVADYLSHLPTSLSLHHFLKYSADAAIKKESVVVVSLPSNLSKNCSD